MNVLYRDLVCGHGDNESMTNIISHYLYYHDLMGVGRKKLGLKKCLVVLSKLLSIHLFPHLLELCLVLMDSALC